MSRSCACDHPYPVCACSEGHTGQVLLRRSKFLSSLAGWPRPPGAPEASPRQSSPATVARPVPPQPCELVICAHLSSWSGYGRLAEHLGRTIEHLGFRVGYDSLGTDERYGPLSSWVKARVGRVGPKRLTLCPPNFDTPPADAWFTMWESTRLPKGAAARLNAVPLVIVPCRANVDWFRASGVTAQIALAPLAVMVAGITPSLVRRDGPTVFGTAGRMAHGGIRKGLDEVMAAFTKAFPSSVADVRLEVKCWPDCCRQLTIPRDPRIHVITDSWDDAQLASWYQGLTAYVTASKGEGWGLHTLEAMSAGRPVIATWWGGTKDFFDRDHGWSLEYELRPAVGAYAGCGEWAVPLESSLISAFRAFRASRGDAVFKGAVAAERAAEFTPERTARAVLTAMGFTIAPKPRVPLGTKHCTTCP